ncbi:MAG: anti-sigma factor [Candidatus Kapabacteria bacterium]|nr:anti-sigma factor [Candidatus Kapabacteria bacterium]
MASSQTPFPQSDDQIQKQEIAAVHALGGMTESGRTGYAQTVSTDSDASRYSTAFSAVVTSLINRMAINPSPALRPRILTHVREASGKISDVLQTTIVQLQRRVQSYYRFAVAASVLFAISTVSVLVLLNDNHKKQEDIESLEGEVAVLRESKQTLAAKAGMFDLRSRLLADSMVRIITMNATPKALPGSRSLVLWNKRTREVYLDAVTLAATGSDKDYQLWGLVDGKPLDLGVFQPTDGGAIVQMKNIEKVDAFAVTLEPKGGSKQPTLEQMVVLGTM